VDLPIENDDFMGFWYGIYWVTLWLWRLQFAQFIAGLDFV
jgi:hypothetical protein